MQLLRQPVYHAGITQPYKGAKHRGIDLGWYEYQGEPVFAAASGTCLAAGTDTDGAIFAVLRHPLVVAGKDVITRYWHLSEVFVHAGQDVTMGDEIGKMGSTGNSTATHLHFETWIVPKGYEYRSADRADYAVDPVTLMYTYADQIHHRDDAIMETSLTLADGIAAYDTEPFEEWEGYVTATAGLNVRDLPSLSGNIQTALPYKTTVRIVDEAEGWGELSTGGWVYLAYVAKNAPVTLSVGDRVKLQDGAKIYGTDQFFASWVYGATLFVREVADNRIVISTQETGAVTGAVAADQLIKI